MRVGDWWLLQPISPSLLSAPIMAPPHTLESLLLTLALLYTVHALPTQYVPSLGEEHTNDFQQQRHNASTAIWLYDPTPPPNDDNNIDHHGRSSNHQGAEGGSRKRKREGSDSDSSDEITLCWPSVALRECNQVTISRGLHGILKQHHVTDLKECFCVTEGFDTFESEISMPVYVDGAVFDTLHYVAKYSGDPLPQLDITFLTEEDILGAAGGNKKNLIENVCWPNPLLGECKEAEMSHEDLYDLLEGDFGDDLDFDSCSCASEGFGNTSNNSSRKKRSITTAAGVQTLVQSPRVTLCYFEGKPHQDALWWEPEGGGRVQKTEFCKQVTVSSVHYNISSKQSQKKKQVFNNGGVYECKGGCAELGYSVLMGSTQRKSIFRPKQIHLIGGRDKIDHHPPSLGEWVYTYQTENFDSRVTLCYFDDGKDLEDADGIHDNSEVQWWRTNDGGMVRKLEVCNQFTMSRYLYMSTDRAKGRQQKFNQYGVYECGGVGGCPGLGYGVIQGSKQQKKINVRELKPAVAGEEGQKKKLGRTGKRRHTIIIVDRSNNGQGSAHPLGEWVYSYHTEKHNSRVTLCYFDGEQLDDVNHGIDANSEVLWWKTNDGGMVRKLEVCNQFTMSRDLYISTKRAPGRQQKFNQYGLYECGGAGGCPGLGYGVTLVTKQLKKIHVRELKPVVGGEEEQQEGGQKQGRTGKGVTFQIADRRTGKLPAKMYTYTSSGAEVSSQERGGPIIRSE